MFEISDSETLWLVVTNTVMGGAVLAAVLLLAGRHFYGLVKRVREHASWTRIRVHTLLEGQARPSKGGLMKKQLYPPYLR